MSGVYVRRGFPGTTVTAVRWTGRNADQVAALGTGRWERRWWSPTLDLVFGDGVVPVGLGWWAVRRPSGEVEVVAPAAFRAGFEVVS
ncbi:hypothetical protein [Catenuloplanes japonicus]|uniref:hypothetical protein n=1 Tax=Catenuloplanes japonicus TaxID=33876 RepID=UPI000525A0BA|nr:hypothetical protein [Catenuloplanes japonicus]